MVSALAPVGALLLSVSVLLMGNGLQSTLLPVRASMETFSNFDIGALGSSYFVGFGFGCLFGARVVRRVGHIRAFTAMVSVASTTALAHALVVEPILWWLFRGLTGFCFAVLYMVIESWLNERSTNETRGKVLSIYTIINLTVITLGQLMLLLYDPATFPLFCLASILVSLAAVPVALTTSQAPAPIASVHVRIERLYRMSPVGFVGCAVVGFANGSFWALGPIYAERAGLGLSGIALFMSITVIGGAVGQWPLGLASDRMDRRKVIVTACIGASIMALAMVFLHDVWDRGILALAFLYGIMAFPIYSLSVAHANDYVPPREYVEASSGLLLVYAVGASIGPMIASSIMDRIGGIGLFAFTAAAHATMAGFAAWRMTRRARAPQEERVEFAEAMVAGQTVSPIDLHPEATPEEGDPGYP